MDILHQLHVLTAFNPQNKAAGTCCTDGMVEPTFTVYSGVRGKKNLRKVVDCYSNKLTNKMHQFHRFIT